MLELMACLQMRRLGCLCYLAVLLPPNRPRQTSVPMPEALRRETLPKYLKHIFIYWLLG